ncbi:hypothetical protein ABC365_02030 [Brevundimonas sp. 3P9-tot-E]
MLAAPLDTLLPAIQQRGEHVFDPLGVQQPFLDVADHDAVQLVHRDRAALAASFALSCPDRAGIIAIAAVLAGAQRHGSTAIAAIANAGQQVRAADHARRRHLRIIDLQSLLHRLEYLKIDQRRHRDGDDFFLGLHLAFLGTAIEPMFADIGAAGQDAVKLADAPTSAAAGEHAVSVEVADDVLDAHGAGRAVAFRCKTEDEPHGVGVQRVDFQLLLHLRAALLGIDDVVADGWQRAVPEALPRVLLQGAQDVLGVLLRLVFVEQRHDPPHHLMDRIVTKFLRHRYELDAVLRQLPVVVFHFKFVAKEPREAMHHHHVERWRLRRAGFDHPLKFGAAVVGRRCARLDEGFHKLVAARLAIGFALPLLVGDRHVMLGLPRRRDAQIERGAQGDVRGMNVHYRPPFATRRSSKGNASSTRSWTTLGASLRPSFSKRTRP